MQATDLTDLRVLYERHSDAPVWTDDYLDQSRVIGFALTREPQPVDQLLVEGEEEAAEPPWRPVPDVLELTANIARQGGSAVQALPSASLHEGDDRVREAFERLLITLGADGEFVRWVLAEIANRQHVAWHVGGSVRDILAEGSAAHVNDLDLAGTIGPGQLWQIVTARQRGRDAGDYRQRVSARLVWSVVPPGSSERVIEYKPLARTGFRFPAWGGDLACDSATRDLTVNALYYDSQRNVLIDPTGRGLSDLHATPRAAVIPLHGDDPVEQACVIVRCIKFKLRWPDLDLRAAASWISALPADLSARIPADRWPLLVGLRDRCIAGPSRGSGELAIAAELGATAVAVLEQLQARSAA